MGGMITVFLHMSHVPALLLMIDVAGTRMIACVDLLYQGRSDRGSIDFFFAVASANPHHSKTCRQNLKVRLRRCSAAIIGGLLA
jgi:hypothetical protein